MDTLNTVAVKVVFEPIRTGGEEKILGPFSQGVVIDSPNANECPKLIDVATSEVIASGIGLYGNAWQISKNLPLYKRFFIQGVSNG